MPEQTIIFDLDGTLVDSNRDLVPALNHATSLFDLPPIGREDVGHVVGQGALMMIRKAFAFHNRDLGKADEARMLARFLAHYEEHICDETVFYPGCLAALDRLADQGFTLTVCTNKYEHLARKLLVQLGATSRFAAITGGDTFAFKKPDGRHLTETLRLSGRPPRSAIMVGDSINDIAAAKAASIPSIVVDFGYSDRPVDTLGADRLISSFDELVDAVDALKMA